MEMDFDFVFIMEYMVFKCTFQFKYAKLFSLPILPFIVPKAKRLANWPGVKYPRAAARFIARGNKSPYFIFFLQSALHTSLKKHSLHFGARAVQMLLPNVIIWIL